MVVTQAVVQPDLCRRAQCGHCNVEFSVAIEEPTRRALILALKQWIVDDTSLPTSVYPLLKAGTLTPAAQVLASFPRIPGQPLSHEVLNSHAIYALGPGFHANDVPGAPGRRATNDSWRDSVRSSNSRYGW
ncbi:MAG TPA: hypothetical protein VI320_25870 [Terracidiphilus sp.]|jgi:hypothetical protein